MGNIQHVIRLQQEETSLQRELAEIMRKHQMEYLITSPMIPDYARQEFGHDLPRIKEIRNRLVQIAPETNICFDLMQAIGYDRYYILVQKNGWINRQTDFRFIPDWFDRDIWREKQLKWLAMKDISEAHATINANDIEYPLQRLAFGDGLQITIAMNQQVNGIRMKSKKCGER
jgi:hypothetical protein